MPNIMAMTNDEVLRRYPHLTSPVKNRNKQCETMAGQYLNRQCKNSATLHVGNEDLCASHAKSLLNSKVNYG